MDKKNFVLTEFTLTSSEGTNLRIQLGNLIECQLNKKSFKGRVYGISDSEIAIDCSDRYSSRTQVVPIRSLTDIKVVEDNAKENM